MRANTTLTTFLCFDFDGKEGLTVLTQTSRAPIARLPASIGIDYPAFSRNYSAHVASQQPAQHGRHQAKTHSEET
ncbi:hypothetical protein EI90DRAFT_3040494 [Cantharellus anzutake]|nr:hypothetical protein EI90DRAFT_3040494 [Cantharellus anzutake]